MFSFFNDTLLIKAERKETIRPEFWGIGFKGIRNIQLLLNVDSECLSNRLASYIVRSYTNYPHYPSRRVRISTFHADTEIKYYLKLFFKKND